MKNSKLNKILTGPKTGIMSPRQVAVRRKIYAEARDWFVKHNNPNRISSNQWWNVMCGGMCDAIGNVANRNDRRQRSSKSAEDFPEYYTFKPEQTWAENRGYWFTRYYKRGGYEKRVSILTALAEGKTYEQWYAEWKAAGKR